MAYGGVTGKVQGAISNCLNEGTITVDNIKNKCYIGGVAGQVGSAADLCWNTGSVTASSTANKKYIPAVLSDTELQQTAITTGVSLVQPIRIDM